MISNGVFKLYKRGTDTEVKDSELMDLLAQPNIFQPQNKWIKNYQLQLDIYGNQFIYGSRPTVLSKYPKSLVNISPANLTIELTGKVFDQVDLIRIVKYFEYKENALTKKFAGNEVLWSKHDDLDNLLIGCSPLKSLRFPLTNTKLAYDYLNIIPSQKGAIGLISTTAKDNFGAIPMNQEDKKKLENQFSNDYGVGDEKKARIAMVDGTVSWQPMTYPTKDLLLIEQIDANKLTICDHFGLNINIFSSKNQTYENVKNAIIQSYNDSVSRAAGDCLLPGVG